MSLPEPGQSTRQEGDVILRQSNNDGDIIVQNGIVYMDGGLGTSAYLCLFGGNEDDPGDADTTLSWWGNIGELPENQYRSRTQYLLQSLPATAANLRRLEDAVNADLEVLISSGAARSIETSVTIPELNRVNIDVNIDGDTMLTFAINWEVQL